MKTIPSIGALFLTAALCTTGAIGQTAVLVPGAQAAPLVPDQIIYVAQTPTPADIVNSAATQNGVTVSRVETSGDQVIAVYTFADGQTKTVAYRALPAASARNVPVPTAAPSVVTSEGVPVAIPAPTVVYETRPRVVYYYDSYPYYGDYWPWYPAISLGFSFRGGHFYGGNGLHGGRGFRGGFHHR